MKTTVTTSLTLGLTKNHYFGDNLEHSIEMYDNPKFEKSYNTVNEFLKDFYPNTPSDNLLNRITEEFNNGGHITFKPKNYKANQKFYFNK